MSSASRPGLVVTPAKLPASIAKLPLAFEPNRGQADSRAQFIAHTAGATVFLTSTGAAVRAIRPDPSARSHSGAAIANQRGKLSGLAVTMSLRGANPHAAAAGIDRLAGVSNYFIGNNPANWKTAIPTYAKVRYQSIYPGIDLVYYGNRGQLEYDLIVKPGADPRAVRLAFNGADALEFNAAGDAIVRSGKSEMILRRPIGYQPDGARRTPVAVSYYKAGRDTVGIRLAEYDRSRPLVIDPTLIYSTYLGDNFAQGAAVAYNPAGGAVVAGWIADGPSFPTLTGPFGPAAGLVNAVVTEFNSNGTALLYSTVFGGSKNETEVAGTSTDEALGVAVDATGDIYLTGFTNAIDFPTNNTSITGGTTLNGPTDAFVTEFNSTLSSMVYSTYLGGSGSDVGNAIAVDSAANAYVAGNTSSSDSSFPTSGSNAFQASNPGVGIVQGFVAKLTVVGGNVTAPYSTYFGEPATSNPLANGTTLNGIAVDASSLPADGNAYVAGSAGAGFPFGSSLGNHTFGGTRDAIVARINTNLSGAASVIWASYLGGSGADWANAIAVSVSCTSNCGAYVAGGTTSADFPTTADAHMGQSPFQSALGGYANGFVADLQGANGTPYYSTYLGGESFDEVRAIAATPLYNNAIVAGVTQSKSFPTVSPGAGGLSASLGGPSGALFTSADGGATLTATGWSSAQGSIRSSSALTFDTGTTPPTIYAGTTTGLWVSTDAGTTFTMPASSGLSGPGGVESLDFSPTLGLFAGTTAGLFLSTDDGATFTNLSGVPGTVYQIGTVSQFTGYYTAATSNGFYVDFNTGTAFSSAGGLPGDTQVFASVIDNNSCSGGSCTIYVGTNKGVYSGTLSSISASLTTLTQTHLNFATVTALAADTITSPSTLYAATLGGAGVVVSTNGFSTLTNATQYTTPQNVFSLALGTPGTVYAGPTSQSLTSVFKSTDSGATYSQGATIAGSITALQVLSGTLYVGEFLQQDAFITDLNGYGSGLKFSGYLGGSSFDAGNAIANDAAGNWYAAGSTFSADFLTFPKSPASPTAYQTALGGFVNSFVTNINLDDLVSKPSSLTFVAVFGGNSTQTLTLTNATSGDVDFGSAPVPSDSHFTVPPGLNSCTGILAKGATCNLSVTFTPTYVGVLVPNNATMTIPIASPGGLNTPTIYLYGTGVAPPLKIKPVSLTFPKQTVGTTSAPKSITLTNSSTVPVTIGSITASSDFGASQNCVDTLAPSHSCTISVTFTPSAPTTEAGTISITGNQAYSPQSIALWGTGAPVTIKVTPDPLNFAARKVDTTVPGKVVTLRNTGPVDITLDPINIGTANISGTNASDFAVSAKTCGSLLAKNTGSCTVTVTFKPLDIGPRTATLSLTNSSTAGPQSVTLNGTGYATLHISPVNTTFASTAKGHTSADKYITVTNNTYLATVTLGTFTSSNSVFSIDGPNTTCGASLGPQASCQIAVTFTPPLAQTYNGVIIIHDNAAGNPQQPEVTGTGKN